MDFGETLKRSSLQAGYTRMPMASWSRKPKREVEVKLRIIDLAELLRKLRQLGAKPKSSGFEQNSLFDTADRGFSSRGAILRIRSLSSGPPPGARRSVKSQKRPHEGVLTYKGLVPGSRSRKVRYKIREELEFSLRDAPGFERLLLRLGLKPWFRYEKFRTRYQLPSLPSLHLDLDETPIGAFLELEGTPRAIDSAARTLGYAPGEYITATYLELYLAECRRRGARPGHMIFTKKKSFI